MFLIFLLGYFLHHTAKIFFPFSVSWPCLRSLWSSVIQFVFLDSVVPLSCFFTVACEPICLVVRILMHWRARGQRRAWLCRMERKGKGQALWQTAPEPYNHSSSFQFVIHQVILQIRASPADTGRNGNFLSNFRALSLDCNLPVSPV